MGHATSAATAADTHGQEQAAELSFPNNKSACAKPRAMPPVGAVAVPGKQAAGTAIAQASAWRPAFGQGKMQGAAGQTAGATRNRGEAAPTQPPALAATDV